MTKLNQPSAMRLAARAVEDDEQRTATVEDDEQRMATVEDDEQRLATVEDYEQRSATTPGRAELQIDKQRFRLVSFNRRALLQIGIAFFVTRKERERDSDRKKKKKKRERKRRRDGEMER